VIHATGNTYPLAASDYCGRLAAQGMVVIALEHRDGSGPMVMPVDEETGKPTPKLYLQINELRYDIHLDSFQIIVSMCTYSWEKQPAGKLPLRADQLKFRIREIYEAFESFKGIVQGNRGETVSMDKFGQWDSFKDQVDCSKLLLTGHSFGGATSVCTWLLSEDHLSNINYGPFSCRYCQTLRRKAIHNFPSKKLSCSTRGWSPFLFLVHSQSLTRPVPHYLS
jgi:hypothetical protein